MKEASRWARFRIFQPDWRTALSGVLIVVSFPTWNVYPLIWLALVPWFFALRRAPTKLDAFIQGVWLSFFMSVGGFYWIGSVLHEFGGLPWVVSLTGLALYSLGGQPQFLVFAPLYKYASERHHPRSSLQDALWLTAVALSYTGLDWLIPKLFTDTLGHSLYLARHLRQAADLGAPILLTFVIVLFNLALWRLSDAALRRWRPAGASSGPAVSPAPIAVAAALLLLACWLYGLWREREVAEWLRHPKFEVQAAAIQGNIGDFDKLAAERGIKGGADKVLATYFGLSDSALMTTPKPDFLVWPETTYPSTFRTPSNAEEMFRDQRVESFVRDRGVPLLFGGYDRNLMKDYNALFLLSPTPMDASVAASPEPRPPSWNGAANTDLQVYRKNILLLFGEYIPGAESIKFLRNLFPQVGNFGRGKGPDVLTVPLRNRPEPGLRVGPVICYEILFPSFVRDAARQGSQLILNVTNDSWFGPQGEPYLHLALSTFRSIETRLPTLRATNTGITAYIDPQGEIARTTQLFQPEVLSVPIPVLPPHWTLLKAWGDWFGPLALLVGLGGLGRLAITSWRARRQASSTTA